jgi:hypothetical protein
MKFLISLFACLLALPAFADIVITADFNGTSAANYFVGDTIFQDDANWQKAYNAAGTGEYTIELDGGAGSSQEMYPAIASGRSVVYYQMGSTDTYQGSLITTGANAVGTTNASECVGPTTGVKSFTSGSSNFVQWYVLRACAASLTIHKVIAYNTGGIYSDTTLWTYSGTFVPKQCDEYELVQIYFVSTNTYSFNYSVDQNCNKGHVFSGNGVATDVDTKTGGMPGIESYAYQDGLYTWVGTLFE